ncbi:MAG: PQQ-binding-like beta-propeller repeat protein [Planctomycetaceae bacterium]|nr:PQQ-binding-like beta-propeller repeat protein [Planctomycetaceae bacterium]
MLRTILVASVLVVIHGFSAQAENWPGWRGPRGDGSSQELQAPIAWDGTTGDGIAWKTDIPGEGHSSPVIWNDCIFLTSCLPDSQDRVLLCLDRATGKTRWQQTVFTGPLESIHTLNSRASATPVTDGQSIFVTFQQVAGKKIPAPNVGSDRLITAGRLIVASYDFDGNRQWLVTPGDFISAHGFSNCPILYEDLVIVNADHDGDSYVVALDKKSGKEVWRRDRQHKIRSYVTPLIRDIDGRTQMVFSGSKHIISLDPRNGNTHWSIQGPTEQFVASLVYHDHLFFMTCGYPDHFVMGIRADGRGDVTESHIAWETRAARCYVPSPVVINNFLLIADDRGTANCFDTKTGKRHWQERLGSGFSASMIHAKGLSYFIANDGRTKIVRPGAKLEIVKENELGEAVSASPAISDGQLFIRSHNSLFCIE